MNMINKFTSFRFQNWESSSTTRNKSQWFTYETNQTNQTSLQWVYDSDWQLQPRTSIYTIIGKRFVDITVSLLVILFVLSWLTPIIALFVCLDSPGPFYFLQPRTGHKGKVFNCLKFRTMAHMSVETNFMQTSKNDSRVTRTGKFLRRTNLDEVLQFVNVLLGDMTLVGPRPHAVDHDAQHWSSKDYRARYIVKPGITGLAQVKGLRGAVTHTQLMNERVRYDHIYIKEQTFILDMKICATTVLLTLKGDQNAW